LGQKGEIRVNLLYCTDSVTISGITPKTYSGISAIEGETYVTAEYDIHMEQGLNYWVSYLKEKHHENLDSTFSVTYHYKYLSEFPDTINGFNYYYYF